MPGTKIAQSWSNHFILVTTEPPAKERPNPDECRVGDWVRSTAVPDWPIGERLHMHPFPSRLAVPASTASPAHPAMSSLFEQSWMTLADDSTAVIWVRKE